jgi:hypothetical protein
VILDPQANEVSVDPMEILDLWEIKEILVRQEILV